jgi:hypothetical protein
MATGQKIIFYGVSNLANSTTREEEFLEGPALHITLAGF